jgi:hypothetical protein
MYKCNLLIFCTFKSQSIPNFASGFQSASDYRSFLHALGRLSPLVVLNSGFPLLVNKGESGGKKILYEFWDLLNPRDLLIGL